MLRKRDKGIEAYRQQLARRRLQKGCEHYVSEIEKVADIRASVAGRLRQHILFNTNSFIFNNSCPGAMAQKCYVETQAVSDRVQLH